MYLRIYTLVCCAILFGFATAAQSNSQRNSDLGFSDDSDIGPIEGSGTGGEVTHDLEESSGSGGGPDDEDASIELDIKTVHRPAETPVDRKEPDVPGVVPGGAEDTDVFNRAAIPNPTEDTGVIMNPKPEETHTSFFAQPGILAAVIGGAVVGLLCAILVVMFIVYRMRKKDEGSYALGEPKQSPTANAYSRGNNKEFYA